MEEKLQKIIDTYGVYKQITIWIEEMSELTKELCKWQRYYENLKVIPLELLNNIKLETTDVQVCLDEIKKVINYSEEEQASNYEMKVNRAIEGIGHEHTYNK